MTVALEDWVIDRARDASNSFESEAWILTARTLTADNFGICYAAYEVACGSRNATAAAGSLQQIYMQFNAEPKFWDAVGRLIESFLCDRSDDDEATFNRSVFQRVDPVLQQSILLELAEQQDDELKRCEMYVLSLRMFEKSIALCGLQLIESVEALEMQHNDALRPFYSNPYTRLAVHEIYPAALRCTALLLQENKIVAMLQTAVRFYISYVLANLPDSELVGSGVPGVAQRSMSVVSSAKFLHVDSNVVLTSPWNSVLRMYQLVAERLHWCPILKDFSIDSLEAYIVVRRQALLANTLGTQANAAADQTAPELRCTVELILLRLIYDHCTTMSDLRMSDSGAVMTFVCADIVQSRDQTTDAADGSDFVAPVPMKRIKISLGVPKSDDIPFVACTASGSREKDACEQDFRILRLARVCLDLLQHSQDNNILTRLQDCYTIGHRHFNRFAVDELLVSGRYEDAIAMFEQTIIGSENDEIRKMQHYLSLLGSLTARKDTAQLISHMKALLELYLSNLHRLHRQTITETPVLENQQGPAAKTASTFSPNASSGSLLHLDPRLHITILPVECTVSYLIRTLMATYHAKLQSSTPNDKLWAHVLILSQYNSKHYVEIVKNTIDAIAKRGKFRYNRFLEWIVCFDLLEELAFLNSSESNNRVRFSIGDPQSPPEKNSEKQTRQEVQDLLEGRASQRFLAPDVILLHFLKTKHHEIGAVLLV